MIFLVAIDGRATVKFFVKRVDFETITRFAAVTVVCDDGKSEADLIRLALIALRGALAEASARPVDCHRVCRAIGSASDIGESPRSSLI
jgi:hypothetical protein